MFSGYDSNKSPCGTCDMKGCGAYHDTCEKYQQWRQEQLDRGEIIIKAQKEESDIRHVRRQRFLDFEKKHSVKYERKRRLR